MPSLYASKTRVFQWNFNCRADRIWAAMADTEKFNEAAKLPKYQVIETPRADGSVDFFGKVQLGPYSVDWREIPTNWVKNSWFRHERRFLSGPLATLCATLKLYPDGESCRAEYILTAEPRNFIGWLMLATTFFSSTKKQFDGLAEQARLFATDVSQKEFETAPPKLQAGGAELLQSAVAALLQTPYEHGLAPRLVELLSARSEMDVRRIRPLVLARKWGVQSAHAIEICLQGAREGLLAISWDLLCPRCQGAKAKAASLDQLPQAAHCTSCNIDYKRDYTKNVEMTFYPSRRLRRIDDREFCLFGPMTTPHIWAQITVEPGDTQVVAAPNFKPGVFRLRTLAPGPDVQIDWRGDAFPDAVADAAGLTAAPATSDGQLRFTNTTERPVTFIIDEAGWSADALTADRAMTIQAFRDLCDDSILRPGDCLQIDQVTIMFVDLKGSSLLYEKCGDMNAYRLVREFFAIVAAAVRKHDGAIVKTVGDAVNAAFDKPQDALTCAAAIKTAFARYNESSGEAPIICKIGIHAGRSIAVTLNNRLDYYGTAVNKASRLSDLSNGADIVLSKETASAPLLNEMLAGMSTIDERATVKGFPQPVDFVRAVPADVTTLDHLRAIAAG